VLNIQLCVPRIGTETIMNDPPTCFVFSESDHGECNRELREPDGVHHHVRRTELCRNPQGIRPGKMFEHSRQNCNFLILKYRETSKTETISFCLRPDSKAVAEGLVRHPPPHLSEFPEKSNDT
jgi:hypothetical protein